MTYMAISTHIARLEASGDLRRYEHRSRHAPRRRLYLGRRAMKEFDDPSSAVNLLVGNGFIKAALTRWVSGGRIYGDRRRRFLSRLSPPPPEIWEIRVTEPIVQARLFGRFAEPDTLILTNFHTRGHLGDKGSAAWKTAMADCERLWRDLFQNMEPFCGNNINAYVTENCDAFPI